MTQLLRNPLPLNTNIQFLEGGPCEVFALASVVVSERLYPAGFSVGPPSTARTGRVCKET